MKFDIIIQDGEENHLGLTRRPRSSCSKMDETDIEVGGRTVAKEINGNRSVNHGRMRER